MKRATCLGELRRALNKQRRRELETANYQRREAFVERLRSIAPERLIFLDESGVSTQITKRYGRAWPGRRIAEATPEGSWKH